MDGPQNVIPGYAGYDEIPGKDQPEDQPWPAEGMDWESQMQAIFANMLAGYADKPSPERLNLDILRWGRETMHPRNYHNMDYWELWLVSVALYLAQSERGGVTTADLTEGDPAIISPQELELGETIRQTAMTEAVPGFGKPAADGTFTSTTYAPDAVNEPKYQAGQSVTTVLQASSGHTREYAYLRGRTGEIATVYPVAVPTPDKPTGSGVYEVEYADINSRGLQRFWIPIYNVKFRAEDLWGADYVEPDTVVYADCWETYVEPTE